MRQHLVAGLFLALCSSAALASSVLKPFQIDSLQQITDERQGRAFMLVLWSIDCPPCLKELAQLQHYSDQFSDDSLVLISTDDPRHAPSVLRLLQQHQLEQQDNWIFSGSMPERLRHRIDPGWYGELPRSYFYDESHQRRAHSGILKKPMLEQWLKNTDQQTSADTDTHKWTF